MTETRSVRTHKPTTNMELATEELELSLGVAFDRFIFSFSYTGGLCSSLGFYQNGTLIVPDMWNAHELHRKLFWKHSGSKMGCKNTLSIQMYPLKEEHCQTDINKTPEGYAILDFQNQKILQNKRMRAFKCDYTIIGKVF